MLSRTRLLRTVVGVLAGLILLIVQTPPAVAAAPAPVLTWRSCGPDLPGLQCATAAVPLDYDHPRGRTIGIALTRIPATDRAHRSGSVFVNPGGPGGSGVGFVQGGFGAYLHGQLRGRFDVVGFDPRGVGASAPLHCFDDEAEMNAFLGSQPYFPYRAEQERPFFDHYRSLASRCLSRGGDLVRHLSTADVARDLDRLRAAVGDAGLSYLGFSYGSYLGTTYANLFPRNVRALVIDGVLDPRLWSSGWQVRSDRVATEAEFEEFLRLCDEAAAQCAFASPEGSRQRWERIAGRLRITPLTLPDGTVYTYDWLIADAVGAMYQPESWGGPEGFAAYLDAIADAVEGKAPLDRVRAATAREPYANWVDSYYGNQCADTQYPHRFADFHRIGRYAEAGSRFGPNWWWWNAGCAGWPVAPDRYTGPWTARTSAPVLVVGNRFDGVTDYAGAQATARLLRNSRLLTYAGWGHTAYGRSACVAGHVNSYLLTGALPAAGTVCAANPSPFLTTSVRRQGPPAGIPVLRPPARPPA